MSASGDRPQTCGLQVIGCPCRGSGLGSGYSTHQHLRWGCRWESGACRQPPHWPASAPSRPTSWCPPHLPPGRTPPLAPAPGCEGHGPGHPPPLRVPDDGHHLLHACAHMVIPPRQGHHACMWMQPPACVMHVAASACMHVAAAPPPCMRCMHAPRTTGAPPWGRNRDDMGA